MAIAKVHRDDIHAMIKRDTAPVMKRLTELEEEVARLKCSRCAPSPVGWGGHLPGKIEP